MSSAEDKTQFTSFLDNRIDTLSIDANLRLKNSNDVESFIDSLESINNSLNNLEEHMHAFTNFYVPLCYDKFANIPLIILPSILLSSGILVLLLPACIYESVLTQSFLISSYSIAFILYCSIKIAVLVSLILVITNPAALSLVFGTAGLLWTFSDRSKIPFLAFVGILLQIRNLLHVSSGKKKIN